MAADRRSRARRRSVGLALGAGGARGLAHIGIIKALARADIQIDAIVGTSSGALVAAVHAAGQLENFERLVRSYEWTDVLQMFDPVWPRSGLMSGDRGIERLAASLREWRIEDLAIPFAAVSVDLVTGAEVLIREGPVIDALRASVAIPGIFVPQRRGRQLLVDGAIRNPVPVSALEGMGADVRVAVNLHHEPVREIIQSPRHPSPRAKRPQIATRVSEKIEAGLARFRRRAPGERAPNGDDSLPNLFEILTASMTIMEYELARHRLASDPVDVVIEPDVHGIRAFEFHKAAKAIQAGEAAAAGSVEAIRKQLRRRLPNLRSRRRRTRAT
jgi:NTE family protein